MPIMLAHVVPQTARKRQAIRLASLQDTSETPSLYARMAWPDLDCRPNVHRQYLRCSLTAFYGPNRSCDLWEGGFSKDQEVNLEHIFRRSGIMPEMWATTIYTTTCYNRSMHYNVPCFVLFQTTPKLLQNLKRKPLSKELYDSTL